MIDEVCARSPNPRRGDDRVVSWAASFLNLPAVVVRCRQKLDA